MLREFRIELNKGGQATNWKQFRFITTTLAHTSTVKVQKREDEKRLLNPETILCPKIFIKSSLLQINKRMINKSRQALC